MKEREYRQKEARMVEDKRKEYEQVEALIPEWDRILSQALRDKEKFKKMWKFKMEEQKEYLDIIPTLDKKPNLINKIANYSAANHVEITNLATEPLRDSSEPGIKEFHFSLDLEGKYHNVKRFLWEIEHMNYIIQMEENGFTISQLNNERNHLVLNLKLFTYFSAR